MSLVTRTLTVTASHRDQAAALCACAPSGAGMFTRAYGTVDDETGEKTITGYISHGPILQQFSDVLPVKTYDAEGNFVSKQTTNHAFLIGMAAQSGVTVTEAELDALFAEADISNQLPDDVMARLGYRLML